ncbi:hypothetical protein CC1G_15441 [Coprinopsis cinerea okayama7|uniref:CUE domain-containing protein n=1 Tax=Coprinopsis cinerea (strain Okayama-7 / 130 / ATCC MYA-4618 / FGSC 9003) TaxID=240176 RepID=D6RQU3_COPC7|nr:hypothetical protein CC1G_15441 [Coprinopsis cinerea okayama7\|eukprot:XP_002910164.1 hypothetical protein CC1G_15441 [Coprinopsis cinerea okayama7\
MGELVNILVAFAVIIFLFRWVTSGSDNVAEQRQIEALGFRPKRVSQDMISTVSNMFPDIPIANIHYDLLRTGNVEQTTNKVLERGFLEAPPAAFHQLYPSSSTNTSSTRAPAAASASSSSSKPAPKPLSLIERYQLEERIKKGEVVPEDQVGGKAQWEDSPEKREASLRERKAQMILAARQRMLAQQVQSQAAKS